MKRNAGKLRFGGETIDAGKYLDGTAEIVFVGATGYMVGRYGYAAARRKFESALRRIKRGEATARKNATRKARGR